MKSNPEVAVGKDRVEVCLYLVNATVLVGNIFLYPDHGAGIFLWKRVLDFFNDPAPYFPFERGDGEIVFVGRGGVMRATIRSPEVNRESPTLYFGEQRIVRVVLSDGTAIEGTFFIDLPPPRTRISDYLSKPETFFHLMREGEDEILHKSHVPEVYPLEE